MQCKQKQVLNAKAAGPDAGDAWTWTAICADTKLIVSWAVGGRDAGMAHEFMHDLAGRLANRVQLTTDGFNAYLTAVDSAFGIDIDYAQLVKVYGEDKGLKPRERKYSPQVCQGIKVNTVTGEPDADHISTSYVERQNLTMRMSMRRMTRLTNGFSKKLENLGHAVSLHFMYYNFARIHQTLLITPAMAAGVSEKLWSLEDIAALADGRSN